MRLRLLLLLWCAAGLSGCGVLRSTPYVGTDELAKNIARNAAMLNDAYARSTNAIILQNILRARDRWPTNYTTLSGIQSQPQVTFGVGGTFAPLGFGNPKNPFGGSSAEVSQDTQASATYTVNPFAKDKQTENVYHPISNELFSQYWDENWPKDVLLLVFAKSLSINGKTYRNDINNQNKFLCAISMVLDSSKEKKDPKKVSDAEKYSSALEQAHVDCASLGILKSVPADKSKKYVYKYEALPGDYSKCLSIKTYKPTSRIMNVGDADHDALKQITELQKLRGEKIQLRRSGDQYSIYDCGPLLLKERYAFKQYVSGEDGVESGSGTGTGITIKLRSIHEAIYFLGEWLRRFGDSNPALQSGPDRHLEAGEFVLQTKEASNLKVKVNYGCNRTADADKSSDDNKITRLLSIYKNSVTDVEWRLRNQFAVSVEHAGGTFYAVKRLEFEEKANNCKVDRTSTVMALLSQIYTRSQSDEFLKGPELGRVLSK